MLKILKIEQPKIKQQIVKTILQDLPEWFGLPESTQAYINNASTYPLWAAQYHDGIVGFITLKYSSEDCAEIDCMGVKKSFHNKGIGKQLLHALEQEARQTVQFLQVKTVNVGYYKVYDQTNKFYQKMGFKKLEVFPDLWDSWNPCLVWIKYLS